MKLRELEMGNEVKITCTHCEGTGIETLSERVDLGLVCRGCFGKGYRLLDANKKLLIDDERGEVYELTPGIDSKVVNLFQKRKVIRGMTYVICFIDFVELEPKNLSLELLLANSGEVDVEVIQYSNFLMGDIPLPLERLTCPALFIHTYLSMDIEGSGKHAYPLGALIYSGEYGCPPGGLIYSGECGCPPGGLISKCGKFGESGCWKQFYGVSNDPANKTHKIKTLRKLRR